MRPIASPMFSVNFISVSFSSLGEFRKLKKNISLSLINLLCTNCKWHIKNTQWVWIVSSYFYQCTYYYVISPINYFCILFFYKLSLKKCYILGGENVSPGYYKNAEKTKEDFFEDDGKRWFRTGDIGEIHEDGVIKIIGKRIFRF